MDAAHKSTMYREVNMTTEAMLAQFESDEPGHFLCECQDTSCSRRLELRRSEYEVVRRTGGYLVSLECIADSEVLQRGDRYAAVAFRGTARGEATKPSRTESSSSGSSRRKSSMQAPSPTAPSLRVLSPPAPTASPSAQSPSRRALRLAASVRSAWTPPARTSSSLPGRSWHRQSQSARLSALPDQRQVPPHLPPAS